MNVSKVAKKGLLYTQTGTPYYASPEVWRDNPYDHKSDIWSMGCVIYELVTLKPPFRADNMEQLFKKVQAGKYPRISEQYSIDLANFIRGCLQVQPHLRPDCDKILAMNIIHKKIVRYFPEAQDNHQYENVLLKTIKLPRNLMYVTE
jgi:NIMA (never in mitosis gene a)-related kinase 1/4/5